MRSVSVEDPGGETECGGDAETDPPLPEVAGVDEATAATLREADVSARDVLERRVSYRDLVEAGLDPEAAKRLRQEHSLHYSSTLGGDLTERSDSVGNLGDNERAWISASDGDWEDAEYDHILPDRDAADVWADRERPTPVTAVAGVGERDAEQLAEAGVTSVKQLGWVDASVVAAATDLDVMAVRTWRFAARGDL